jgi:hypothetical protein
MELKHRSASRPVRNRALVRSLAAACGIGIGYCRGRTTSIFATHRTPPLLFRSFLAPRAAPPTSDGRTVVEEIDHPAYREHPSFVYCLGLVCLAPGLFSEVPITSKEILLFYNIK